MKKLAELIVKVFKLKEEEKSGSEKIFRLKAFLIINYIAGIFTICNFSLFISFSSHTKKRQPKHTKRRNQEKVSLRLPFQNSLTFADPRETVTVASRELSQQIRLTSSCRASDKDNRRLWQSAIMRKDVW